MWRKSVFDPAIFRERRLNIAQFPKGRIDSLTNHLVKKCPALPMRDRQRALLQFHELPLPDNMAPMAAVSTSGQLQTAQTMHLPFAPAKQLSALETLAEVSRQHLDMSGQRMPDKQSSHMHSTMSHAGLLEEFLIDDRPEGSDLGGLSQAMDMSNAPAMPAMYQFNGPLHHSPTTSPHLGSMPLSSSTSMAQMVPSLVMAASAANELMPLTNGLNMEPEMNLSDMHDRFFHPQGRGQWPNIQSSPLDPVLQEGKEEQHSKGTSHPRPIAMNPNIQHQFTQDFSVTSKPAKPKVRGRFSDSRRKEVQEVRKRGACIRCRMLKKPCSGENPCNTCQNVESARLWKQPCIRTRIADEFSLYAAGLHGVLAHHATLAAKGQIRLDQTPGRIEVTHFPDSGNFATFTPLKCLQSQMPQNTDIDPEFFATQPFPKIEFIAADDDSTSKLDSYIKQTSSNFLETESSPFMKKTLETASSIVSASQDQLLAKVMDLWKFTRILTSKTLELHVFSNTAQSPTLATTTVSQVDAEDPNRTPITALNHPASHSLIKMQIMGASEKRAACLARLIMNDLERRLLQRQQANPFETFLVAVILLACVERMCWLFRTWEAPPSASLGNNTEDPEHAASTDEKLAAALRSDAAPAASVQEILHSPLRNPRWPLDRPPASFSRQGERFSDMLNMLLKMRGVPPKPTPRNTDGMLVVWADDANEKVKDWYDGIAVTTQALDEKAGARFVGDDPQEWELKYVGKIIRGD